MLKVIVNENGLFGRSHTLKKKQNAVHHLQVLEDIHIEDNVEREDSESKKMLQIEIQNRINAMNGLVLHIDTSACHNKLKRHYSKCFEMPFSVKNEDTTLNISQDLVKLVRSLTQIGEKYGVVDTKNIRIPKQLSSEHV